MPWSHIIRRSLIAKYDIKFTNLRIHDDMMFSFCVTLRAANFVRVPNIIYTWRTLVKSNSRGEQSVEKLIYKRGFDFFSAVEKIDAFMNNFEELKARPEYKYAMFDRMIASIVIGFFPSMYAQIPAWQIDGLLRRELARIEDKDAVTSYIFARMNILDARLMQMQRLMTQQPKEVQDFQRQQEIIRQKQQQLQQQAAQIQQLQQQLKNVHDIFK